MRYHINQDSLGETSEFQAEAFAAAVQKSLPRVEIILCEEGQPQSNTEEAENLCESEARRGWQRDHQPQLSGWLDCALALSREPWLISRKTFHPGSRLSMPGRGHFIR